MAFAFQKMDVYRASMEFVSFAKKVSDDLPRGSANLRDQIMRAATSITLNIAEGSGKRHRDDKRRYYGSALGSVSECVAVLEIMGAIELAPKERLAEGDALLNRINAMLLKLDEAVARRDA